MNDRMMDTETLADAVKLLVDSGVPMDIIMDNNGLVSNMTVIGDEVRIDIDNTIPITSTPEPEYEEYVPNKPRKLLL